MDGQQYLNQIAESSRPMKSSGGEKGGISRILSSKFFIVGAIGVGLLILIMIIGSALGGGKDSEKTLGSKLKLHLDNTAEVIETYQPNVKSSELRSNSSSLHSVLIENSKKLTEYLEEKYNFKDKDVSKAIQEEATLEKDGLENELFEAKINGILDRIYAHKMAYEISLITTEEAKLIDVTKSDTLKETLSSYYDSLVNLYDKFNDFSETK